MSRISAVSICNIALLVLGVNRIQSLDQDSPSAIACKELFDLDLEFVLSEHNWSFATEYANLALLSEVPKAEWSLVYQEPSDCVRVQAILDKTTKNSEGEPFALGAGGKIYTDTVDAIARYTKRIEDPSLFPPYFADMFSKRLAVSLSGVLNGVSNRVAMAQQLYIVSSESAMIADASQGKAVDVEDSLISSRTGANYVEGLTRT